MRTVVLPVTLSAFLQHRHIAVSSYGSSENMGGVEFQIMSDLHLEMPKARPMYTEFTIKPKCPNLVLLGDIGQIQHKQLFEFLEAQLRQFERVFFLLGNHEPYGLRYQDALTRIGLLKVRLEKQRLEDVRMGTFIFLNRTRFDLDGSVTVLGCTLHSHIYDDQAQSVAQFVSDFSEIEEWTVDRHTSYFETDLKWLNDQVSDIEKTAPRRRIVIFTHYSPTRLAEANNPQNLAHTADVGSAFVTDLSEQPCWRYPMVKIWAFGHTHFNCDFVDMETGKRVVANQKGYQKEELSTFDPGLVVSLEQPSLKLGLKDWKEWKCHRRGKQQCVVQ